MGVNEEQHNQCQTSIENTKDIEHLKESDKSQWGAIRALQNRLPVWATIVISLLTFLLGTAVGALYFALNYLGK